MNVFISLPYRANYPSVALGNLLLLQILFIRIAYNRRLGLGPTVRRSKPKPVGPRPNLLRNRFVAGIQYSPLIAFRARDDMAKIISTFCSPIITVSTRRDCFFSHLRILLRTWRGGRVVEGARLESVYTATYRGFESLSLRQFIFQNPRLPAQPVLAKRNTGN